MKIERDERRFDFHDIGLAIKRAREASGMTQEQLAYIVDRASRDSATVCSTISPCRNKRAARAGRRNEKTLKKKNRKESFL